MQALLSMLQGKKTHIVVLLYVILTMAIGGEPGDPQLVGLDVGAMQKSLAMMALSTVKAAFDRFVATR